MKKNADRHLPKTKPLRTIGFLDQHLFLSVHEGGDVFLNFMTLGDSKRILQVNIQALGDIDLKPAAAPFLKQWLREFEHGLYEPTRTVKKKKA